MEPRIQYAKASDGVSIAYARAGSGPTIVVANPIGSHVQLDWEGIPAIRLAAQVSDVIWYDSRGSGLSDRTATDFTIEDMLRDLAAIVNAAALDRFALVATGDATPIAIAYTAQNPDRITHLVLMNAWVTLADYRQSIPYQIEEALRTRNPQAWLEAVAPFVFPDSPDAAKLWLAQAPQRFDTKVFIAAQAAMEGWNVEEYLAEIKAPTLVVSNPNARWSPPSVAQRIAATIPDCQLVFEDSRSPQTAAQIGQFILGTWVEPSVPLAPSETAVSEAELQASHSTAIIFFADIADSTALTERFGDKAFREKARHLDTTLRKLIRDHSGTCIDAKTLGDGVLATFTSAAQAIEAALACGRAGADGGLPLHLGLHAGDVIREENNVFGGAVNIAARISGLSAPGEVLVSDTLRGLARTSAGVAFEDRGEQSLKGVGEAVRVWAVHQA